MRKPLLLASASVLALFAANISSATNAQPYGWHMMGPWGGYGERGPLGMIVWILILALVIAGVAWFLRTMTRSGYQLTTSGRRSPGLDALEERYARGEIKREEYLEKKRDITG